MSTLLDRPHQPAHQAPSRGSNFSGTLGLLRLYLRRDRIVATAVGAAAVGAAGDRLRRQHRSGLSRRRPDRAGFAASIMASPAQRALYGNVYGDSLGATGIWKAGMFHVLIAVAVILTVIRHTRADEETGRAELIDSTAVGRFANLTAALLLSAGAAHPHRRDRHGRPADAGRSRRGLARLRFGVGVLRSGVHGGRRGDGAAVAVRAVRPRRGVRRARRGLHPAGRRRCGSSNFLTWLSPLGWSLQVRPYAGDRFWVLLLHIATTAVLVAVAYRLLARRDVGAGMLAERPGPPSAGALLHGVFGLAWRLNRGSLILWTVGLCRLRPGDRQRGERHRRRDRRQRHRRTTSWHALAAPTRWNRPS